MTQRARLLILAATLWAGFGCGRSASPEHAGPGTQNSDGDAAVVDRNFTLKPGQSIRLGGTRSTITLVGIPEDSRCHPSVQCIWAGNARLDLRLDDTAFSINTTLEPHEAVVRGLRFQLVELTQRPLGDTVATNYAATLKVNR